MLRGGRRGDVGCPESESEDAGRERLFSMKQTKSVLRVVEFRRRHVPILKPEFRNLEMSLISSQGT